MQEKLVSIIVPVYKAEAFLKRCVDSLLAQTYPHFEVILINDGSPDHSHLIMEEYKEMDARVVTVYQENKGVSGARNRGLKEAKGDFIMFVDADDWLDLKTLESAIAGVEKTGAQIVRFGIRYEYSNGKSRIETPDFTHEQFIEKMQFPQYIYPKMINGIQLNSIWRTLYPKELIQNIFFSEKMHTAEDLLFNMEVFTRARSFLYLALPYYHYYRSEEGLTGSGMKLIKKYKYNYYISKLLISFLPKWGMDGFYYRFLSYFRILAITYEKVKREIFQKKLFGRRIDNEE